MVGDPGELIGRSGEMVTDRHRSGRVREQIVSETLCPYTYTGIPSSNSVVKKSIS